MKTLCNELSVDKLGLTLVFSIGYSKLKLYTENKHI